MTLLKKFLALLLVILAYFGLWTGQDALFEHHVKRFYSNIAQTTALSGGEVIKYVTFGFENFVADIYWMRTIQYVGTHVADGSYSVLEAYANIITDIDPKFAFVYHFSGLLLPNTGDYKSAEKILLKGEMKNPENFWFPSDLGFLYFYYLEDYDSAIEAYKRCVPLQDCPGATPRLVATLLARSGKEEIAFQSLLDQFASAESDEQRDFLKQKVEEVGKLILLQKLSILYPPETQVSELIGKSFPLNDPELSTYLAVVESLIEKKLLSDEKTVLKEMTENPFQTNSYLWDATTKKVKPKRW